MKRIGIATIIVITLAMLIVACSSDTSTATLAPPSWAIGTWIERDELENGFQITSNDIIVIGLENGQIAHSTSLLEASKNSKYGHSISESISSGRYKVSITLQYNNGNTMTMALDFKYIDVDHISVTFIYPEGEGTDETCYLTRR